MSTVNRSAQRYTLCFCASSQKTLVCMMREIIQGTTDLYKDDSGGTAWDSASTGFKLLFNM